MIVYVSEFLVRLYKCACSAFLSCFYAFPLRERVCGTSWFSLNKSGVRGGFVYVHDSDSQ